MQVKKGISNIFFGFISQLIALVLGIVIPRLFITSFGSDVNGLVSSINQIFAYIALFEAGVGTATVVALYGPVANRDKCTINSILSATHHYYKRTGLYYLAAVIIFAAVYPFIVTTNIDKITIAVVILFSGMSGVINYFFYGKVFLLLQAEGKNYVISNLTIVVTMLISASKIILLMKGYNIIAVQSTYVVFYLMQAAFVEYYIKKKYKWLNYHVAPDYKAISKKTDVLVHQISYLIFSNTDVITLTIFTNLKIVSVYTVYTLIFGVISTAIGHVINGFTFTLGQMYNTDRRRFIRMNDVYELYFLALVFALYAIVYIFALPFLKLYSAGITDINYVDKYLSVLFVTIGLLSVSRLTCNQAINIAGYFRETRWRTILESCINLGSSLILVNFFGIYGVLMGTGAALLYRTNDMIFFANRHIMNRGPWRTYRRCLLNLCLFFAVVFISRLIPVDLQSYVHLFLWAIVYCLIVIPLFIAVNLLAERDVFRDSLLFIKPYVRKILKRP
jgi:O-antigen/teichoic acid export membrane protein